MWYETHDNYGNEDNSHNYDNYDNYGHYDNYYNGIDQFAHSVGVAADSSRHVIVDIMEFGIIIKKDVPISICITKDCSIPIKVNI